MGTKEHSSNDNQGLADVLFSKTRRAVLGLLFSTPDQTFHVKEIVRAAGVGSGSVQRELMRLESAGLITSKVSGNRRNFRANRQAPIFDEIRGIVRKTFGVAEPLQAALAPLADVITVAFVFGSVAQGSDTANSDIDLLVVSESLAYPDILAALSEVEGQVGRTVQPFVLKPKEFQRRLSEGQPFIKGVLERPKIFLIGTANDLPTATESG